jgi:hypothetical protein
MSEGGQKCRYEDGGYRYFDTGKDPSLTVEKCKLLCAADAICQTISWTKWEANTQRGEYSSCELDVHPHSASYLNCSSIAATSSVENHAVNNWSPPAKLIVNGDFETGCMEPWNIAPLKAIRGSVVECNKKVKGDCLDDGKYHFQITGDGSRVRRNWSFALHQRPIVEDHVTYRFTVFVKGTLGSFEIIYPANSKNYPGSVQTLGRNLPSIINGTATGEWTKHEFTAKGWLGSDLWMKFQANGMHDWQIDGVTVVKVPA